MLLVDLGNSCLKWAQYKDGALHAQRRECLRHLDVTTVLAQYASDMGINPRRVLISSVAGVESLNKIVQWIEGTWQLTPERVISSSSGWGVKNSYVDPTKLGSDRWAVMVAAHYLYSSDVCVIDCGTAITADIVLADGQHLGGYIVPGLRMMQDTLLMGTAGINLDATRETELELTPGISTAEGIGHGALLNVLGFIEKIQAYLEQRFGAEKKFNYLLTGGDAEQLIPYLSRPVHHEPWLVLQGLAVMAGNNE